MSVIKVRNEQGLFVDIPIIKGEQGLTGSSGVSITTITSGTPTQNGDYTVTPITINKSDNSSQTVNISAKNGTGGSNEEWVLVASFTADGVNGIFEKTNINLKKAVISMDAKIGTTSKTLYLRVKTGDDTDYLRTGYISGVVNTTKEYITIIQLETQPFLIISARVFSKPDTSQLNISNVSLPNTFEKKGNIKAISIGHQQEKFVVPEGTIINIYGIVDE